MKTWLRNLIVITLVVIVLVMLAQDDGYPYTIDKADIVATVTPEGELYVEELVTYSTHREQDSNIVLSRYFWHYFDDIEFFEAYIPPTDRELGQYGYTGLQQLNSRKDYEDLHYTIQVQPEKQQVYYRYRIKQAAVKYQDTGMLDWFVYEDDTDGIHDVTITLRIPETRDGILQAYVYDRNRDGQIQATDHTFTYSIPKIGRGESPRLTAFFPSSLLYEVKLTDHTTNLADLLTEQEQLQAQLNKRPERLALSIQFVQVINYVVLGLFIYILIVHPLLLRLRQSRAAASGLLEEIDPIQLVHLYRGQQLQLKDVLAGVFSLRRRGWIEMRIKPVTGHLLDDPHAPQSMLQFIFTGQRKDLTKSEQHLLNWLFQSREGTRPAFHLEQFAGPGRQKRTAQRSRGTGGKHTWQTIYTRYQRAVSQWSNLLKREGTTNPLFVPSMLRKIVIRTLLCLHLAVLLFLYISDARYGWEIALLAVIAGGLGVIAFFRPNSIGSGFAFLFASLFFNGLIAEAQIVETTLLLMLLSAPLIWFTPRMVIRGDHSMYYHAVMGWRRLLKRGGNSSYRLERMVEDAILLDVGKPFLKRFTRKDPHALSSLNSPLVQQDVLESIEYALCTSWRNIKPESDSQDQHSSSGSIGSYDHSSDSGNDSGGGGDGGGD